MSLITLFVSLDFGQKKREKKKEKKIFTMSKKCQYKVGLIALKKLHFELKKTRTVKASFRVGVTYMLTLQS